jgi:hypothetical protein
MTTPGRLFALSNEVLADFASRMTSEAESLLADWLAAGRSEDVSGWDVFEMATRGDALAARWLRIESAAFNLRNEITRRYGAHASLRPATHH